MSILLTHVARKLEHQAAELSRPANLGSPAGKQPIRIWQRPDLKRSHYRTKCISCVGRRTEKRARIKSSKSSMRSFDHERRRFLPSEFQVLDMHWELRSFRRLFCSCSPAHCFGRLSDLPSGLRPTGLSFRVDFVFVSIQLDIRCLVRLTVVGTRCRPSRLRRPLLSQPSDRSPHEPRHGWGILLRKPFWTAGWTVRLSVGAVRVCQTEVGQVRW